MKRWMAILAGALGTFSASDGATAFWSFHPSVNPLASDSFPPQLIQYAGGLRGETAGQTLFGRDLMRFGTNGPGRGYLVPVPFAANGGGTNVNSWTAVMDVQFPASSSGKLRALLQTDPANPEGQDAEFYINARNQLVIGNTYGGTVPADTWVRLAVTVDFEAEPGAVKAFVNGVKVAQEGASRDGRYSLAPGSLFQLFTDGHGDSTQPGFIDQLVILDRALPEAALAEASLPGAPAVALDASAPYLVQTQPGPEDNTSPLIQFAATIYDGDDNHSLDTNRFALRLDNTVVTPVLVRSNNFTLVSYSADGLFTPASSHNWTLSATNGPSAASVWTKSRGNGIRVANYYDWQLPTPIYFEDFEGTAEGLLPAGWTNESHSFSPNAENLADLNSQSFTHWLVIDSTRFSKPFGIYDQPAAANTDYQRVLGNPKTSVVNSQVIRDLAQNKIAFANSGYMQAGGSQILYLSTPDYKLTGQTNVALAFHSIWEQSPNAIAGVEYSLDQGRSWNSVAYFLDPSDIVHSGDAIDAVATLTAPHSDVASYTNSSGAVVGGTYGAFIGAPVDQRLAPFIEGRPANDPLASKRFECFRLPLADNQSSVRVRFLLAGRDAGYFGLDNIGVYSLAAIQPPLIVEQPIVPPTAVAGSPVRFSVQAAGVGLRYQWFAREPGSSDWSPVPGATNASYTVTAVPDGPARYVEVSNEGGATNSLSVIVNGVILDPPQRELWQFDGSLSNHTSLGTLAPANAQSTFSFGQSDGTTVPNIKGVPVTYLEVPAFPAGNNGLLFSTAAHAYAPASSSLLFGQSALSQYTFVWDLLVPDSLGWTPLFNAQARYESDAELYVTPGGAIAVMGFGNSPDGVIAPNQWRRVALTADLRQGRIACYVDGAPVFNYAGADLSESRLTLSSATDSGPDAILFGEPTGSFTHRVLVNSMYFTDHALTGQEIAALGSPSPQGIELPTAPATLQISKIPLLSDVRLQWNVPFGRLQKTTSLLAPRWEDVPINGQPQYDSGTDKAAFFRFIAPE